MRSFLLITLLLFASLGGQAMADQPQRCGDSPYSGSIEDLELLEDEELSCNYNGVKFKATLGASFPRCPDARPFVSLIEQDGIRTTVTNITIKKKLKKIIRVEIETSSADFPILCSFPRR